MKTIVTEHQVWAWLGDVPDPEIPVVTVVDLGMIRDVAVTDSGVEVQVSPTYSGCPATEVIENAIAVKLRMEGIEHVSVSRILSPPWTTDWITEVGKEKLRTYGIAPPTGVAGNRMGEHRQPVQCPRCGSNQTTMVSEFGSTACKSSCKCDTCLEPFEYFKCI